MNTSGEAADQVVRMMLNGAEVLIKLSGSGAKNAAVLLYSIARQQKKAKGKARLESMLRSGKPLKVYTFRDSDLPKFKEVAKQYGILYTVLKEKDKTGGVFDVMVRAEDESKIARITERFSLARVDTADLRAEIIREKENAARDDGKTDVPETDKPEKSAEERLADEILDAPVQKERGDMENPTAARAETVRASETMPTPSDPSEHSCAPATRGEGFIKSFAAVCLEGAVIVLGCIIYSLFAASPPSVAAGASAITQVWTYVGELLFNMLVLVGTIKLSDRVVKDMMGL